jgi:hypothetical protein
MHAHAKKSALLFEKQFSLFMVVTSTWHLWVLGLKNNSCDFRIMFHHHGYYENLLTDVMVPTPFLCEKGTDLQPNPRIKGKMNFS